MLNQFIRLFPSYKQQIEGFNSMEANCEEEEEGAVQGLSCHKCVCVNTFVVF